MLTTVDITDRKTGEDELKSSRLLMKGAIESQKDTILLAIDHNYRYLYFNEIHFESMKNAYHSKVELGMNILDNITSEEDRKAAKVNYDRALSGESHSNVRRYGDKMYAWYESFFNPIFNEKNEVIGATALARNINEKVEADEAIKKSNELHKAILLSALDGFCLLDTDGRILEVNEAYCRMSGYSEQELRTMSVHDLEFIEASDSTDNHLRKIIAQGHDIFESRHKAKDGSHFDVEVSVQYRPFENGRIVVFLHDITNRKRAERMLKERETRLNQTQEMAHLGSWELDLETQKLIWSDEVYRIFGLVPQEHVATHAAFMEFVHPDDREALNLAYFNSIKEGKEGYEIEHRIIPWKTDEVR
jgi:PAS domain S-box-containing protein